MADERPDLIDRHLERKVSLVTEIIADGKRNGEFEVEDLIQTAKTFINATDKLTSARNISLGAFKKEDMEAQAKDVVELLVRALEKK